VNTYSREHSVRTPLRTSGQAVFEPTRCAPRALELHQARQADPANSAGQTSGVLAGPPACLLAPGAKRRCVPESLRGTLRVSSGTNKGSPYRKRDPLRYSPGTPEVRRARLAGSATPSTPWEPKRGLDNMRDLIAATIFYILSVLLFPVTLIGYVIWVGKSVLTGRGSGVSGTAQGPLSARWFEHNLGTREDEPANRLLMVVPGISPLAVWLVAGPTLLAHRVTGYVPRGFRYPFEGDIPMQYQASARITFFDSAVDRYLADSAQFVILGAGFDTRAFRLTKGARGRSFEVDAPKTQAVKREMLEKAGIDPTSVTFVAADFEKENWMTRLVDADFDPGEPALFLWEGVMTYLDKEAVEATLRKVAGTAKGSVVAFDYFTTEPLESNAFYWRYARAGTRAAGEPLKFGIDSTPPSRERLVELLRSCGLSLVEQCTLGQETEGKRAWGGFATAIVK